MISLRTIGQGALAGLLGLAIVIWSVMPATSHAPAIFETLQDHAEMMAEHGHTHGLEEDLYWAMHGHSHDSADHDHSPAVLTFTASTGAFEVYRTAWRLRSDTVRRRPTFLIERPPRG
ncbi:hypothetical protein O4G76_17710 [Limimaricola sp. G21655-S1]|uniref:hypothetical protein n=1 Tax=Limimaricola sp. G21655-S1 TaxID=3014768 RepID=UPI0022B0015F|nr:hypothetical protein [Limimaricola sp. G21655-S1]MCZ4262676.1 hypothetical protein [Limimaricola sp. G21655-S1]